MKERNTKPVWTRLATRAVVTALVATTLSVTGVPMLSAQAAIYGIFNDADRGWQQSEIDDGWNKRIAQGAVFLLSGNNLAPTTAQVSGNVPLPTELGGTSVRVTVGDAQVDAFLISVGYGFIRAVLPDQTPDGLGTIVVRHSGRDGWPRPVRVVRRNFRIYGRTYLSALAYNVASTGEWQANTYRQPARPGQLVVLKGTGLGAHNDLGGLEVLVGAIRAPIQYAGPSDSAGQDQLDFVVPAGVEGCHVPVRVKFPEEESNSPILSIAAGDGPCSDPFGLPANLLAKLESGRILEYGDIYGYSRDPGLVLTPIEIEHEVTDPGGRALFGASFWTGLGDPAATLPPLGTCFGQAGTIGSWSSGWVPPFDAGTGLNLRGPQGLISIPRRARDQVGSVGYGTVDVPDRLEAGEYVLDNGEGSSRIGPFQTTFNLSGPPFDWNRESVTLASLQNGVPITWNGGDPAGGFVMIYASLGHWVLDWTFGAQELSSVTCVENVEKGSFTLPTSLFASLAAADLLTVHVAYVFNHRFPVPGLDFAQFNYRFGSTTRILLPK